MTDCTDMGKHLQKYHHTLEAEVETVTLCITLLTSTAPHFELKLAPWIRGLLETLLDPQLVKSFCTM